MVTARMQVIGIYVNRSSGQWVVRDADGTLWVLPATERPWDDRQLFSPNAEPDLEAVPGHYKSMLDLP